MSTGCWHTERGCEGDSKAATPESLRPVWMDDVLPVSGIKFNFPQPVYSDTNYPSPLGHIQLGQKCIRETGRSGWISDDGLVTFLAPSCFEMSRVPKHDGDGLLQAGTTDGIKMVVVLLTVLTGPSGP